MWIFNSSVDGVQNFEKEFVSKTKSLVTLCSYILGFILYCEGAKKNLEQCMICIHTAAFSLRDRLIAAGLRFLYFLLLPSLHPPETSTMIPHEGLFYA